MNNFFIGCSFKLLFFMRFFEFLWLWNENEAFHTK